MRKWRKIGGWGRNHSGDAMDSADIDGCRGGKRWRRLRPLFRSSRGVLEESGSLGWNSVADSLGQYAGRRARARGVGVEASALWPGGGRVTSRESFT